MVCKVEKDTQMMTYDEAAKRLEEEGFFITRRENHDLIRIYAIDGDPIVEDQVLSTENIYLMLELWWWKKASWILMLELRVIVSISSDPYIAIKTSLNLNEMCMAHFQGDSGELQKFLGRLYATGYALEISNPDTIIAYCTEAKDVNSIYDLLVESNYQYHQNSSHKIESQNGKWLVHPHANDSLVFDTIADAVEKVIALNSDCKSE